MEHEKEQLIKLAVLCNAKEISSEVFHEKTGRNFSDVWRFYNKDCVEAWRNYTSGKSRKFREDRISDEVKKRVHAIQMNLSRPRVIQQNVPTSIKQLAEIYVRVVRGEMFPDIFLQGFKSRFRPQIDAEVNRRRKLENYGWDGIDWDAVEKDPLLSQLLS